MNVIIKRADGRLFPITVEFYDSILQMKQKIQNWTGIPVANQILGFGNNLLLDNTSSVVSSFIRHASLVQLYIVDSPLPPPHLDQSIHAQLHVRVHTVNYLNPPVNVDLNNSVMDLRHMLHQTYGLPSDELGLIVDASCQLTGDNPLYEYGVSNGSVIDVFMKEPQFASNSLVFNNSPPLLASSSSTSGIVPPPCPLPLGSPTIRNMPPVRLSISSASGNMPPGSPSSSSRSNTLRIQVLTPCQKKLNFDVDPTAKVRALRDKLEQLRQWANIELSPQGYFFIHSPKPMEEEAPFISNNVQQNDIIAVLNGTVG